MNQAALLGLFYNPVKSFRSIIEHNLTGYKYWIIALTGLTSGIFRSLNDRGIPTDHRSSIMLTLSVIAGILSSFVIIAFLSWSISLTGKWLKGTATRIQIENVIAFCYVILTLALFLSILHIMAFNRPLEGTDTSDLNITGYTIHLTLSVINTLLVLYFFILITTAISIAQNFSFTKAVINLFLAVIFLTIPFILFGIFLLIHKAVTT